MRNFLIHSALALAMGVTGVPLAAPVAVAQDLEIQIGPDGARIRRDRDRCDPDFEDCYRRDRYERRDRRERRGCSAEQAIFKAERMGIRRARILSAGRRTIEVGGRSRRGNRVAVVFGRERGCPVYD